MPLVYRVSFGACAIKIHLTAKSRGVSAMVMELWKWKGVISFEHNRYFWTGDP